MSNNIFTGRKIIPYPSSYRIKIIGYSDFRYPLHCGVQMQNFQETLMTKNLLSCSFFLTFATPIRAQVMVWCGKENLLVHVFFPRSCNLKLQSGRGRRGSSLDTSPENRWAMRCRLGGYRSFGLRLLGFAALGSCRLAGHADACVALHIAMLRSCDACAVFQMPRGLMLLRL